MTQVFRMINNPRQGAPVEMWLTRIQQDAGVGEDAFQVGMHPDANPGP